MKGTRLFDGGTMAGLTTAILLGIMLGVLLIALKVYGLVH